MFYIQAKSFVVLGKLRARKKPGQKEVQKKVGVIVFCYDPDGSYKSEDAGTYLTFSFKTIPKGTGEMLQDEMKKYYPPGLPAIRYDDFRRIVKYMEVGDNVLDLSACSLSKVLSKLEWREGRITLRFDRRLMNPMNIVNTICGMCSSRCYSLAVKNGDEMLYVPVRDNKIEAIGEDILCFETKSDLWMFCFLILETGTYLQYEISPYYGMDFFTMMCRIVDYEDAVQACPEVMFAVPCGKNEKTLWLFNELGDYIRSGNFKIHHIGANAEDTDESDDVSTEMVELEDIYLPSAPGEDMEIFDRVDTDYKYPAEQYTEFVDTFMFEV